jgi:DUF4097 and DUF4098 domain-containing protein YvlB
MSRSKWSAAPLGALAALMLLLFSSGCGALDFVPLASAEKTLSEDFKTSNAPKIVIETFNGQIDVTRGKDAEVLVDVTKRASGFDQPAAEAALDSIQVSMIQKDDGLVITAERLDNRPGNFGASVVIAVPAAAQLELKSSNGAIICEEIEGQTKARTSNGKLEVLGGKGEIELSTSNGAIEVEATDAVVDARTSNGRIEFRGSLADKEQRFKTSNGRIELVLPDDARFRFEGHTSNSRVQCDFPVNVREDEGRHRTHLEGVVGDDADPDCEIIAATSNGSITVKRASDAD